TYNEVLYYLTVLVIFQMIGGITDFYRSWRGVRISTELTLILKNWSLSILLNLSIISLYADDNLGFSFFMQWYLVVSLGFICCRTTIRLGAGVLRKLGFNTRRVAVVGTLPAGINLLKGFLEEPWLGFVVKGIYDENPANDLNGIPFVGDLSKLISDARHGELDRIYIAMNMHDEAKIKKVVSELSDTTCSVLLIPDIFTFNILQSRTEEINGVPVVPLYESPLSGINMVFKRLED
ncbi:TPA: undecaprenyl-phosphate glucose phosphotransferase, partial [Escherichia coli]|nr:undecaprenyl-phosphate glucose phosphotransferase [Escherichia coli]